jgi:hypothetical protein
MADVEYSRDVISPCAPWLTSILATARRIPIAIGMTEQEHNGKVVPTIAAITIKLLAPKNLVI